jgi:hypothetical protein
MAITRDLVPGLRETDQPMAFEAFGRHGQLHRGHG